jgi:hypothetical protein
MGGLYDALAGRLPRHSGARAIIRADLARISDSCGYGAPLCRFGAERSQLAERCARRGPDGLRDCVVEHGARSVDGLPALRALRVGPTGTR